MPINNTLKDERIEKYLINQRLIVVVCFLALLCLIVFVRLFFLQIFEYNRYSTLSKKNQLSFIPLPPPRGIIYDRNGVLLAENRPVYALEIVPERIKNLKATLLALKKIIPSISDDEIDNFYRYKSQNKSFDSVPLKLKLSDDEVALFSVNQHKFPGVSIKARLMRHYPQKELTAHILGYVGRINARELNTVNKTNYRSTNFIGKVGIEKYYEKTLHGKVGFEQVESDASGRLIRSVEKKLPIPGKKLFLTIDVAIQEAAQKALANKRGSVVVMDPNNGEILAMVSTPSYDPNLFVNGISHKQYQQIAKRKDQPLYNRSIRGLYPPASTIKPFIGLGGLDQNIINSSFKIYDPGWYKLANAAHVYRDWKRNGHGWITLKRAIVVSCDTYFYHLASLMGISKIEDILSQFGLGHFTRIDMGEELKGIVPNKQWKRTNKHLSWYGGDTLITGIGQGFMLATPLQLATATSALAKHGRRFRPHLLLAQKDPSTHELKKKKAFEEYPITLKNPRAWPIIINAMQEVITSSEGTGFRFGRNSPYTVAAKSGTAQVVSVDQFRNVKYEDIPENLRDHSLFIGFAPIKNPKIAVAVIVENDFIASNVARKAMDAYFKNHKNEHVANVN